MQALRHIDLCQQAVIEAIDQKMSLTGVHFDTLQDQDAMVVPITLQIQSWGKFAVFREHKTIKRVTQTPIGQNQLI
jgi:hypothetical protein